MLALALGMSACRKAEPAPLSGFELHPDFYMELAAAEPLVFDPVDMQFDEAGRAYVLEMPGYPLRDAESRLVRLEDADGDGVFDQRQVFSDKLGVASSFMPFRKGFLVASPPELLWIADLDGDGQEDAREVVLEGFSNDNLQHNFNGLTYGLDNWIYIANGGNSGSPSFPGRPETAIPLRGGDLRLSPDLGQLARVGESSGGFKLTFDPWGHLFETHNLEHNLHLVFEDRYLEGVPGKPAHALVNISDHEANGLSRVYPIGEQETRVNHPEQSGYFSGSCGITYYGGGLFPDDFGQGLFVADVVLNLVHFDHLRDSSSAFATSRYGRNTEFLASSDRAFRPVNFSVGPDGSLYVLDMHRDVIEHPEWIPDELEKDLDLHAGKEKGRIYRIWPRKAITTAPGWDLSTPAGLVQALGHPNQWVRTTAQRLLVLETPEVSVPDLEAVLRESPDPLHRLHALWTLEGLDGLADAGLIEALADASPGVRENALKIAEGRLAGHPGLFEAALTLCADEHPRVRLRAVLALSGVGETTNQEERKAIGQAIKALLDREENDPWVLRAATAALLPQATPFLREHVANWQHTGPWSLVLRDLAEATGRSAPVSEITGLLASMDAPELRPAAREALLALAAGWSEMGRTGPATKPGSGQGLEQALNSLEDGSDRSMVLAVAGFRKALGFAPSATLNRLLLASQGYARDSTRSSEERLEWLQLAGLGPFNSRKETLGMLLDSRVPLRLQREALQQLWDSDDAGVPVMLFAAWDHLGPEARRLATDILLYKEAYHKALVQAMEMRTVQLGEFNLDLERRRILLFSEDPFIRERAEKLFSDAGVVQRAAVMEAFRPSLALPGNPERGANLFAGRCATCHQMGDTGVSVGPVLSEIGRKSRETLLHDILDPNAAADPEYLAHTVVDDSGTLYTGVVVRETDQEVALQLMGGEERVFRKDRIRRFTSSGLSLMPEGLEQGMTPEDMADLLAYLQAPR
jgi:putative membrane-bound dehydrogenase-like protein